MIKITATKTLCSGYNCSHLCSSMHIFKLLSLQNSTIHHQHMILCFHKTQFNKRIPSSHTKSPHFQHARLLHSHNWTWDNIFIRTQNNKTYNQEARMYLGQIKVPTSAESHAWDSIHTASRHLHLGMISPASYQSLETSTSRV